MALSEGVFWRCPRCQEALHWAEQGARCEQGHHYDRARQGYVNLLLANQKHSPDPGDSGDMVTARRRFLSAGHYHFMSDKVASIMANVLPSESFTCLDVGCGEGSHIGKISDVLPEGHFYGVDISKHAVKRAAVMCPRVEFAVASSARLPMLDGIADMAFAIFSPISGAELQRVLVRAGFFLRVSPGPEHLHQLKTLLYKNAVPHSPPNAIPELSLVEESSVQRTQEIVVDDLIAMTPLQWRGDPQAKSKLAASASMAMTFDFNIQLWQKREVSHQQ